MIPEITDITDLVQVAGLGGAIILLLILLLFLVVIVTFRNNKNFANGLKSLTSAISLLTDKVSSPHLDLDRSMYLFRETMKDHIYLKAQYIGAILKRNDLQKRKAQIKKNIEVEFKRITNQEIEDLGKYRSICGNIGKIIQEFIDWDRILPETYEIVFSDSTEPQKIEDLKSMMQGYVDQLSDVLEERGRDNHIGS